MWQKYVLLPIPMAITWLLLTSKVTVESFFVGYVLSIALAAIVTHKWQVTINLVRVPTQVFTLIVYIILLFRDIFLSSVDVMLRVLGIKPLRTGIIAVLVDQDEHMHDVDPSVREFLGGMSAHGITITPGELVVDYSPDRRVMYVHCLDVEEAAPQLDIDQNKRERIFRRILGND